MSCLGTNFGIAVFPPIMSFLEELYGTTDGLSIFGAFLWNTAIVGLITTTCSSVDNSAGADYDDEENQVSHDDHKRRSSHFAIFFEQPPFIAFFVLSILVETSFVAWAIYLVPYGESKGLEPNRAALLSTIGGTSGLLGKIFLAMVANFDSLHPLIVFTIPSLIIAFSYLTTFFWSDFAGLATSSVMSGFCIGFQGSGRFTMLGLVVSDEYFKTAVTWLYSGYILSTLSGGIVAGYLRDISGNFQAVFGFLAVVCLLNAAISLLWILSTTKKGWKKSH
ncbi:putative monocarboxylate transporter 14 [Apostichopus japonicus]|uniref:Putative monocarboxylate transporter 14 n=1 Tax=Stichopus japonicus TaxID=307972 RepID=A0A2G8JPP3_STIJA|nr:putative monocarboxylate transporter 14 [Apostichopus japonicus]